MRRRREHLPLTFLRFAIRVNIGVTEPLNLNNRSEQPKKGMVPVTDLAPILHAVRLAAVLCHEVQRHHLTHSEKTGSEPVTIADYGVQAILCRALQQSFPNDSVIAEESARQFAELVAPEERTRITQLVAAVLGESTDESEVMDWLDYGKAGTPSRRWLIDPVDGTKGFLAQRHYVIAIALLEDDQPTAAVIGAPHFYEEAQEGALLFAANGEAFIQPMRQRTAPQPLRVSARTDPQTLRALESVDKSHASFSRMEQVRAAAGMDVSLVSRMDSQEKYAHIAAGEAELYLRLPRRPGGRPHMTWDHAPGMALVTAAGGKVTDVDGSPLDFSGGRTLNNQGVIVTNGHIHDHIIEAVQKVLHSEA